MDEVQEPVKRRWRFEPVSAVLVFIALVVAVAGGVDVKDSYLLKQRGEVATATVLDKTTDEHGTTRITVRFATRAGETVRARTENYKHAQKDEPIEVIYDPQHPQRMQAADWSLDYWKSVLVFGAGVLGLLIAAAYKYWRRRP
jgi:hypothetical protein